MMPVSELTGGGYKAKLISTIVDHQGFLFLLVGYKAKLISTIVD